MVSVENGQPINLGSDEVTSIKKLAETIVRISGKSLGIVFDRSGPKGVNRYCADLGRMESLLLETINIA